MQRARAARGEPLARLEARLHDDVGGLEACEGDGGQDIEDLRGRLRPRGPRRREREPVARRELARRADLETRAVASREAWNSSKEGLFEAERRLAPAEALAHYEMALELYAAYHRYLYDYCMADPARLKGAPLAAGIDPAWTAGEIRAVLQNDEDVRRICACYDITQQGNWEHTNIPNRMRPMESVSHELNLTVDELQDTMRRVRPLLYEARKQRVPPALDDKVLTDWNALAAKAFFDVRCRVGAARPDNLLEDRNPKSSPQPLAIAMVQKANTT